MSFKDQVKKVYQDLTESGTFQETIDMYISQLPKNKLVSAGL